MGRESAISGVGVVALKTASQSALAEPLVFGQRGDGGECLTAIFAFDLRATVGVHAFVAAQVGELRVRLHAHLALERFDGGVDVLMLLEARRGGERFAAFRAGM